MIDLPVSLETEPPARLTFDEHRELSRELRKTHLRLLELCNLVSDVYGPANPSSVVFRGAAEAIGHLRDHLSRQAAEDWPARLAGDLYR